MIPVSWKLPQASYFCQKRDWHHVNDHCPDNKLGNYFLLLSCLMCQILVALMFNLWEYHDANAVFSDVNIFADAHLIAFSLVFFQKFQFSGNLPLDPTKKREKGTYIWEKENG